MLNILEIFKLWERTYLSTLPPIISGNRLEPQVGCSGFQVLKCWFQGCSNSKHPIPKDTIYALLSIYKKNDGSDEELVPNYEKSIIEVYRDYIEYCVSTSRSIDIICRHWAPAGWSKSATLQHQRVVRKKNKNINKSRVNAKMPSWVPLLADSPFGAPRQATPGRVNGDSLVGYPDRKCYNACGGTFQKPRFDNDPLFVTDSK